MRDAGRIREKIEIVLDSRQVVSLVLGSAVALGIVFYLGVTVGRDLAGAQQPAPPTDPLEQLDRQAEALAERLTFPEALTDEKLPAAPPAAPSASADARAEAALAGADAAAEAKAAEARKAEEARAAAEAKKAAEEKAAAEARAREEKARAEQAAAEARAREEKPRTESPAAAGQFTVQVGAMPARAEADALVARLRAQGLSPYVVEADIPGRGVFYRVRIGRFRSREEAKKYLADLQRETQISGFVAQVDG